jgi:hypothetical protein
VIAIGARGQDGQTTTTPLADGTEEDPAASDGAAEEVLVTVAVDSQQAASLILTSAANALHLALLSDGAEPRVGAGVDSTNFLD